MTTPEPTIAGRDHDTGPLAVLPTPPGDVGVRRMRGDQARLRGVLVILVVALVVGGLGFAIVQLNDPLHDQRPVEVVKGFAAAIEAKDPSKMLSYVEPTLIRREIGPELRSYVSYIEFIRFRDAHYDLLENDGERALVRWTATAEYQLHDLGSGQHQIDATFELTKIEGAWYLRRMQLPRPQAPQDGG